MDRVPVPESMSVVAAASHGGPEVLVVGARATPAPGADEVLVRVAAAGINRPDILQRKGLYPPPPGVTEIPGLEIAGTIVGLGPGTRTWRAGDRVCALVSGGGYAEYCVASGDQCLPVPRGMSMAEAASLPETFFTVWSNVFDRAVARPGESLLVHGGASGIG
ncbi:MAG: alcohol dehydrogenase catalytic domain-containing protein, partial [Acidiferrobacterales bacterium]